MYMYKSAPRWNLPSESLILLDVALAVTRGVQDDEDMLGALVVGRVCQIQARFGGGAWCAVLSLR